MDGYAVVVLVDFYFPEFIEVCRVADFDVVSGMCNIYTVESGDDTKLCNCNGHVTINNINDTFSY